MTPARPIMVVEDDDNIRDFVELILEGEGYPVVTASNGAIALDLLEQCAPSLILLDVRMPVMDGREFARRYRAWPDPRAPIVVVTAAVEAAERAAELGAAGYLAKPFDLNVILRMVQEHLQA